MSAVQFNVTRRTQFSFSIEDSYLRCFLNQLATNSINPTALMLTKISPTNTTCGLTRFVAGLSGAEDDPILNSRVVAIFNSLNIAFSTRIVIYVRGVNNAIGVPAVFIRDILDRLACDTSIIVYALYYGENNNIVVDVNLVDAGIAILSVSGLPCRLTSCTPHPTGACDPCDLINRCRPPCVQNCNSCPQICDNSRKHKCRKCKFWNFITY